MCRIQNHAFSLTIQTRNVKLLDTLVTVNQTTQRHIPVILIQEKLVTSCTNPTIQLRPKPKEQDSLLVQHGIITASGHEMSL